MRQSARHPLVGSVFAESDSVKVIEACMGGTTQWYDQATPIYVQCMEIARDFTRKPMEWRMS